MNNLFELEKYNSEPIGREEVSGGTASVIEPEVTEGEKFIFISDEDIGKLLVDSLKKELKARKLATGGR